MVDISRYSHCKGEQFCIQMYRGMNNIVGMKW